MPKNDYNNTKSEDEKIIKGLFVPKLCSNVLVYDNFADEISQKRQHRVQINNMMLKNIISFNLFHMWNNQMLHEAANYTGVYSGLITTTHDFFSL